MAAAITAKAGRGGYDGAGTAAGFAGALGEDLRELGRGRHFQVIFDPEFRPGPPAGTPPSPGEMEQRRKQEARDGFGIEKVERLPGNVACLEVRGFGSPEWAAPAYAAAAALIQGADALILDLRRNGGGEPQSVAALMSHFFAEGDIRHLNDIFERSMENPRQFWTDPAAAPRYTGSVYVLTSAGTFSGGEECAYDFQTQKRATLVGETTGGGANPGGMAALGGGFAVFLPTGRAVNPVTHANWDQVGVKPDLAVPAAEAFRTAYVKALQEILREETDPGRRAELEALMVNPPATGNI